jgi:fatty-acyl-CoA synthase
VLATTIASILRDAATAAPDATALVEGTVGHHVDVRSRRRFTYAQLLEIACRSAGELVDRFEEGSRLACFAPSTPEALVLSYAAANAGLVLVPLNPALRSGELAYVLGQSGASGIVVAPEHRGVDLPDVVRRARTEAGSRCEVLMLDEVVQMTPGPHTQVRSGPLREPAPDDIAQLVYTSGTTGRPKGARLTHAGMTNAARFGAVRFGLRAGDVYVDTMPLHHVGGQVVAFQICQLLATAVLVTSFDPGTVLELLESERADITVGVPTMLLSLIEHPDFRTRDLSALRSASSGGSVVPPDLVRHIENALGVRSTICFGQTETCGFISQTHLDDSAEDKATTLGQPLPRVEARVVDRSGEDVVACGEVGELQVRSPFVMAGYHDMPDATRDAFAPGGWLRTGDLVTMDERGFLTIAGRAKDMIVTGGENVFPVEIEAVLCEHPDVMMAAVIGLPDRKWGEQVVAVIRPAAGATPDPDLLTAYLKERLAPFKIPKRIVVTDELPLTASGKIQKFVLREQLESS